MVFLRNTLSLLFFLTISSQIFSQTVSYRFVYAGADCATNELCFDVEAQGDQAGLELDEFNMRMFVDDAQLTFIDFRNPDPLYYLETAGNTQTGVNGSGSFFGFSGNFVYITDNYKRIGAAGMELATGADWSYLFQACFSSVEELAGMNMMCPSLVWDHDTDGSGFASGSDGIESLLVNPAGGPSLSVEEAVVFFNWDYNAPTTDNCFDPNCTVLAAEVINFGASTNDCESAIIKWEVAQEINVHSYRVERKLSFQDDFTAIEVIEAIGNTIEAVSYMITDDVRSLNGLAIYRLVEVMADGTESYLSITEMNKSCGNDIDMSIYPNPTTDYVNMRFDINSDDTEVRVEMMDMSGKVIKAQLLSGSYGEGSHEAYINLSNIQTGTYIMKAQIGDTVNTEMIQIIQE